MTDKLYLVCETPEKFTISVNDTVIENRAEDYFLDKSFEKLEISKHMKKGENKISFTCNFKQSEAFYENMRKAKVFESEKNKLAYDMEIEAVYLVGDFSVRTEGTWTELDRDAMRYRGELVLAGNLDVLGDNPVLMLERKGFNVMKVDIKGVEKTLLTKDFFNLKEYHLSGKTGIKITLMNNLRNLLGPHHLPVGECLSVVPGSFYKESCVWNDSPEWNEDYCFVSLGI